MPVVHALFDSYADASRAVRALEARGIASSDISIVANRSDPAAADSTPTSEGAELGTDLGAIAGGTGGLLAGLGIISIPGLGPLVGAGWLVSTMIGFVAGAATGLAVGGIAGALMDSGVPEPDAQLYAEGLHRGGTVVTARVDDSEVAAAEAVFDDVRRVDVAARRLQYAKGGWPAADAASSGDDTTG